LRSEPPAASKSILAPATTLWNRFRTLTGFNLIGLFADSRPALALPAQERCVSRRKPSPLKEVLPDRHGTCILVERVEKPTDNNSPRCFAKGY
jgi:hypothetical protein